MPDTSAMLFDDTAPMTATRAVAVYEFLRGKNVLPHAHGKKNPPSRHDALRDIIENYDALLLDGFGVLNTGAQAVPHADAMINKARAAGITVLVITNAGSRAAAEVAARYRELGFDFAPEDIITSRDALLAEIAGEVADTQKPIGVVDDLTIPPATAETGAGMRFIALDPAGPTAWDGVADIAFLGAVGWDETWQQCLYAAAARGATVHIANPDVTAPVPGGFTFEPGYWAAKILAAIPDARMRWYGKPHAPVFDLALRRFGAMRGMPPKARIAMVGDTLHTDILGGAAAGIGSVLVLGHGLFRNGDVDLDAAMRVGGITPDVIVERV